MKNKGITLVALVITIIILLILAGITISQLTNSGLFENTKIAKEKYENSEKNEDDILKQYENAMDNGKISSARDTVTLTQEQYDTLMNKIEKVETISTTKLCYGNTTLSYDFSKYKRLRCYAFLVDGIMIFEVDLGTVNAPSSASELSNNVRSIYKGGSATSRSLGDLEYVFMCNVNVNSAKNTLTLDKLGWSNGSTYNDRIQSGRENQYYIYKIEGIY